MEQQGLSEGSLRNSHREIHAVRRKPAKADLQECASALLERCSEDSIIRQRIDMERAEPILKKAPFFVLENEGRAEPGFLIFLKGQAAVFLQNRRSGVQASTLRLRTSTTLGEGGGTILVATLDDVLHTLRLEDVWMWKGQSLCKTETFTARRQRLKEFVEQHWIPDARLLGGILVRIAHPVSMEEFSQRKLPLSNTYSLEFIPDQPGRRRFVFYLEAIAKAATGHAGLKQERGAVAAPRSAAPIVVLPERAGDSIVASIEPIDKMPDVYTAFDATGNAIGRASVQQFSLSSELRLRVGQGKVWVTIAWNEEFQGHEILGFADPPGYPDPPGFPPV
jgi:hypothetical protein